jgi:hypothetical protein
MHNQGQRWTIVGMSQKGFTIILSGSVTDDKYGDSNNLKGSCHVCGMKGG